MTFFQLCLLQRSDIQVFLIWAISANRNDCMLIYEHFKPYLVQDESSTGRVELFLHTNSSF